MENGNGNGGNAAATENGEATTAPIKVRSSSPVISEGFVGPRQQSTVTPSSSSTSSSSSSPVSEAVSSDSGASPPSPGSPAVGGAEDEDDDDDEDEEEEEDLNAPPSPVRYGVKEEDEEEEDGAEAASLHSMSRYELLQVGDIIMVFFSFADALSETYTVLSLYSYCTVHVQYSGGFMHRSFCSIETTFSLMHARPLRLF